MPCVRHILKNDPQKGDEIAPAHSLQGNTPPGNALGVEDSAGPQSTGLSTAELIAERLRQGADQRAALAQGEINRLQVRVDQLESHLEELKFQNLPLAGVKANLDEAHERLEEAKSDLVRAHEARQNTDLTASLSQEQHEGHELQHHEAHEGTTRGISVRGALGRADAAPAQMQDRPAARRKL
jgi:hypothetical protein